MKRNRTAAFLHWVVVLVVVAGLAVPGCSPKSERQEPTRATTDEYWPTTGWRTSSPEGQGFDSVKLAEGLRALKKGKIPIHSLLIIRHGEVVLDAYSYPYDGSVPHKLASVTKSVMTTLIGIAADQGKLQLDQPMLSFFRDRAIASLDSRKEHITVRHLASMMNGFESGCLGGDEPTLDKMRANPDWVQAALDRKMAGDPGTKFCYDSPGMHLLSAILQEATGTTALDFARRYLFEPLGIREVFWESDPQGYTHGWSDLYLKPLDAAKIGYLWLHGGVWEGRQIVSASWVAGSVQERSSAGSDGYGYGWWVARDKAPDDNFFALGRGGQYIRVYPSHDAIVVVTGHGVDYSQVQSVLEAFASPEQPLPENPSGAAELEAVLADLVLAPHPWPTGPLPDTAKAISGKTYSFEPNPAAVDSLRIEFQGTSEAMLFLKSGEEDLIWPVGLDGRYRLSPDGTALRGYWTDSQTFVIEVFEEKLDTYVLRFNGDRLEMSSPNLDLRFEMRSVSP